MWCGLIQIDQFWFDEAFVVFNYPVAHLEWLSALSGVLAVWLAARENILSWPVGLVNILSAFFIYHHVQLYADMFLQVYFFGMGLYGWHHWQREHRAALPLKWMSAKMRLASGVFVVSGSAVMGWCMTRLHIWFPQWFFVAAAFPYADSAVAVGSVLANFLLARRYLENWILWIGIDLLCVYLYFNKGILLIALEFLVFLALASYGLFYWTRLKKSNERTTQRV
ncbi:MAG: Nicotinamide riboside transporter PnuC [Saprospiraceae bacterium]|nr:Nicotinamide riboside transporter PnuC [Saprospiraceae bacterium]